MNKIIRKRKQFLIGFIFCLSFGILINFTTVSQWCIPSLGSKSCLGANAAKPTNFNLTASGKNGAVVSTSRDASLVGLEVLKKGGNAIDAAVAVGYALAVTDPCCGNLGGGGFMTIRFADGEETFINFRETAPLKSTADLYLDKKGNVVKDLSTKGYLAVGVPGTVKGLNYALDKYGTMSREQVITPAIKLASEGYTLQQGDVAIFTAGKDRLEAAETAKIFLNEGKVRKVGDVLQQLELAATLEQLIPEGDAFYQGDIAKKVVAASEANGGILSSEDFATYTVSEYEPISCNYRGYRVISSPPPGGGTTLCQMLNILSGYDLQQLGWRTPESLHPLLSAMLFAFSDRNKYLGDPDFVDNPLEKLLSSEYAGSVRQQIATTNRAIDPETVYDSEVQSEGTNTTHYSVMDKEGNAVAVTYTINSYFGAGVVAPGTGFILNNEMDDFTAKVGVANQFGLKQSSTNIIEPKKRPLSSMSPTIVIRDNEVFLITGTPGGSTIPTTVLQVVTNIIDYQKTLTEAVNNPRFHYQGFPNQVLAECDAITPKHIRGLRLKGYQVIPCIVQSSGAESILVNSKTKLIEGVNDSRKPAGAAVAY
jgi:gamma-glutamyltranspeptidase / glutathione hydrolase